MSDCDFKCTLCEKPCLEGEETEFVINQPEGQNSVYIRKYQKKLQSMYVSKSSYLCRVCKKEIPLCGQCAYKAKSNAKCLDCGLEREEK